MRMNPDLAKQLAFIAETDALKRVERRTSPIGLERRENSAEHSWQAALTAMALAEHANEAIDLLRVLQMLLIHDVPEVDVGDTFHYDKQATAGLHERERAAAERLFSILPAAQGAALLALWDEFEARATPEARYAAAVDRFMAFIMNSHNGGGTWVEHALTARQVLDANAHVIEGSRNLWEALEEIVAAAEDRGQLGLR